MESVVRYGGNLRLLDEARLRSAVLMPAQSFGDEFAHKDLYEMAAAYLFHIVEGHPFVDGNQATGTLCALVFLSINGIEVDVEPTSIENLVWSVARGETGKDVVAEFFRVCGESVRA